MSEDLLPPINALTAALMQAPIDEMATGLIAKLAIDALRSSGYAIVPIEPTEAMICKARDKMSADGHSRLISIYTDVGDSAAIYRAMIDAALQDSPHV